MGIDSDTMKFLAGAQRAGVSFQRTAMLGRQNFYPSVSELGKTLDGLGVRETPGEFLARSDGYAEHFFQALGAEEIVAIDNSAYEGAAIVADMNATLDPSFQSRFSVVFDGGCLEHIFNFPQAIRNCMEMVAIGGHFLAATPANNYCGHGFYQFSPELFFRVFSAERGFITRAVLLKDGATWYQVKDPAEVGERVELRNTRPTLLFVLAKKIADPQSSTKIPQQSDYVRRWVETDKSPARPPRNGNDFLARLRDKFPSGVKEFCRPWLTNLPIGMRSTHFTKMSDPQVLAGKFCLR